MDSTERFAAIVQGPEPAIPLDEATALVAARVAPPVDVNACLGALDDVAAGCDDRSLVGVVAHLVGEGFTGNVDDYYDPSNSLLPDVLARRTGIPITLSIVAIEVGRRAGVPLVGIGMPGHFLVRDAHDDDVFADVFAGRVLRRPECAALLAQVQPALPFDDEFLRPVGTRAIVARLLANLKGVQLARGDRRGLIDVLSLRVLVPGVPLEERRELASVMAANGQFLDAARILDDLAAFAGSAGDGLLAQEAEQGAVRLRARAN